MVFSYLARIRVLSAFILICAFVILGKLYLLQVVDHQNYLEKADRQYTSASGGLFDRGTIYFTAKDGSLVSAATLQSGFIVAVNPEIVKDPEYVYEKLNSILPTDRDSFMAHLAKKNDTYEEIAKHVDTETGQKISALKIAGLSVYKDRWRFYPGKEMAANTIGMLGYKGDEYAGRYGLERQYENILKRGDESYVNFFAEIFSDIKSLGDSSSSSEGDIVTTIEPTVEAALETVLSKTSDEWHPDQIGGIIINPSTGDIYAMAVRPDFDPNSPGKTKNISNFSNPLVENVYEMGSIIKPLTLAAGINEGLVTASTTYYDAGFIMVDGKRIGDFDNKVRGTVTMQDMLSQSLNVGAAKIEQLLGNNRFNDYFYNFGVAEKSGIDLPNESRGLTDNLKSSRDIEHVTAAFGQGISLTPINAARVLSAVANGGIVITPLSCARNKRHNSNANKPHQKTVPRCGRY
jgi:cell division protein FtsI/penicillin-binding protein 2